MNKLLAILLAVFSVSSYSGTLPAPTGKVILTITGKIQNSQSNEIVEFDLEQLKQLRSDTFTLQTRWDDSAHEYHGPLLSAVLEHVGAQGSSISLTALNDYAIDLDAAYINKYQPILAWQTDGKTMSIRDKGPLWLLLPHDKYPELNAEIHTGRMIWQLTHIEIK